MRKLAITVLLVGVLIFFSALLFAQEVSEKKEIAVFKLSYYDWDIPDAVLGNIDEELKSVFINIGRFNVIGMTQRLEEGDLGVFIDKIKEFKEEDVEIPEEVQMGHDFFTEADMNQLIGSFIVVIPSVSNFILESLDSGYIEATVKTAFNFINVQEGRTFAQFFVETEGTDENEQKAIKEAVDGIPMKLTYEIRKISEFQLKTGILEVRGSEVILELGRDLGLKLGDEYLIVLTRVLNSGKTISTEKGLIIIKSVDEEVSVGKVLYSKGKPQVGDQLKEIPRLGIDTTPYVRLAMDPIGIGAEEIMVIAGVRQSISRGFYSFRPLTGLEMPLHNIGVGIPVNFYVGGELDLYFGRFQLIPMAAIGLGGVYLYDSEDFYLSHIGGMANVTLTFLFHKNMKLTLDAGILFWPTLDESLFDTYGGVFIGGGLCIKY